jgi:hypothetical protein
MNHTIWSSLITVIISYLKRPDQFFCLPSLQLNDYRRQITRGLKLTTRLQQVPRLSTYRSVRPLPCMSLLACPGQMLPLLLLFYLFIFNCNWFDNPWQYNSTHLHTKSTQTTENGTHVYITIKKNILVSAGRAPPLRVLPWHLPYS